MQDDATDQDAAVPAAEADAPPPGFATRTVRREAVVSEWRADCLARTTPVWAWILAAVAYSLAIAAAYALPTTWCIAAIALATVAAWTAFATFVRRDRDLRALAAMTPVVEVSDLKGRAAILVAASAALTATLRNPRADRTVRLRAVETVLHAALPIMGLDGVTAATATVDGYPAWPEVDRTELPGVPGDMLSVHVMRIDATARSVAAMAEDRVVFAETVSRAAGGVVPPLRAIEAVVAA